MIITIIILAISAIFFAIGKTRSDVVALCALISLLLFNILTPAEALAGFSNPVLIMMVGLFVVGGGILQTGLAKMISSKIMKLAGNNKLTLFLMVMLVTAVIGAFVSNTGTVALMLPIVVSLAAATQSNSRELLMPLAFASSLGGMLTLIGTPPNLVIQETLIEAGYPALSFFSFLPVGVICILVGIAILLPLSKYFLSTETAKDETGGKSGKTLPELVNEYRLTDKLHRLIIPSGSRLIGHKMADLDLYNRYKLSVMEKRTEETVHGKLLRNISQTTVGAETIFTENDIIYVSGEKADAERFANEYILSLTPINKDDDNADILEFYDIGMAELLLLPNSRLTGRPIRNTALRAKYRINVIAIRRKGDYIRDGLADVRLTPGDILLVQSSWDNIARLNNEEDDWVVLGQPLDEAAKVTLTYKAPVAAIIMTAMVAAMVFDFIPIAPVTAIMLAAVLMVICGCFRNVDAAYKTINWESIVLIGAMMPMSIALEKTGASSLLSHTLVNTLGAYGPVILLGGIYFTTSLLTMFISNTATAVLMAPIALSSATELGVSPYAYLFAVTLGASMCFASPFSTPPNALVMQAGRYSFMDYIKVGLPLQIIMGFVMIIVLPLLFPL